MKKIISSLFLILVFSLTGCGNKEATIECNLNSKDPSNNYELKTDYTIHAKGDIVEYVETTETIISDKESVLNYFKEYVESTYKSMNDSYGGYDNKVTVDGNKLVSTTKIDYTKMDMEKFIKDNTAMKSYVNKNNQLKVEGVKKIYEQLGAVCK